MREKEKGGAPAEVAARDREGRESLVVSSLVLGETPKSEGRREEDEKLFEPMGREGKMFLEKLVILERGLAGGKVRGEDDLG